jgi:hypothetical protein
MAIIIVAYIRCFYTNKTGYFSITKLGVTIIVSKQFIIASTPKKLNMNNHKTATALSTLPLRIGIAIIVVALVIGMVVLITVCGFIAILYLAAVFFTFYTILLLWEKVA